MARKIPRHSDGSVLREKGSFYSFNVLVSGRPSRWSFAARCSRPVRST